MGKVHVIPTGFEYDRIVRGLEEFGVSKIYLLRGRSEIERHIDPIVEKIKGRYSYLLDEGNLVEVLVDFHDLTSVFKEVKRIIEIEGASNEVLINISTSSKLMVAALLMAAWCSDTSRLLAPPVIYYVVPKGYLFTRISTLRERILNLVEFMERTGESRVKSELRKVGEELRKLEESGLSFGVERIVKLPFMPIKPPSEFEMRILRALRDAGGEVARIGELVDMVGDGGRSARSKVGYHLDKLVEKGLVEKRRWKGGVSVRLTDLGEVFASD